MTNKKKVLLWGVYSPWTMNFVEYFLLENDYEVWVLHRGNKKEYDKFIDFYREKGIHLIEVPKVVSEVHDQRENKSFFKICYSHFLLLKAVIKSGPFDLINMQYVEYLDLADVVILKYMMKKKLILSYWGSDLLRIEKKKLLRMGIFAKHADFVTFDNKDLENKFKRIYKWAKKMPLKTVFFGLPVLDIIDRKYKSGNEKSVREKWGISEDKIVIAIGYNGIPEQQHKKVLGVIKHLEDCYKEKIVLLLQMSYGGTKEYRRSVITAVKKTGCEYIDVQKFLTNDEVAELRIVTDIYINAQVTDAFSGSVCENLFCNTLVINARWLRYKEFETYRFKYFEFEKIDEINYLIKEAMQQKADLSINRELVWKLRSWKHCSVEWEKIYRKIVEN